LRHCFATHALEDGVEPVFIQQMIKYIASKTRLWGGGRYDQVKPA